MKVSFAAQYPVMQPAQQARTERPVHTATNQSVQFAGGPPKYKGFEKVLVIGTFAGLIAVEAGKHAIKFVSRGRYFKDIKPLGDHFKIY